MKDYKNTLFMGKTPFKMRGNLGQKEPLLQEKWDEMDLYHKVLEKNKNCPDYTLHDGPPYANGDIHLGHALNKILKDFIVRYKNMNGFKANFIPGWDTHGLPIENAIQKSGVNRKTMSKADFRDLCEEYAFKQVERQKIGFKRLGVIAEFDDPYITLQHDFESDQILVFAEMAKKGLIYKGLKPVYWSPSSESALAEAEIEYQDKTDSSIYFKLPIIKSSKKEFDDASFLVWTTTPWTLPANLGICAGPRINYVLADTDKGRFVFGEELLSKLTELLDLGNVKVISNLTGKDLLGLTYKHPLFDRVSPCILGDYVTTSDGTGLVHIAPGHGEDDFIVGKEYGLEVLCPVDSRGYMTSEAFQYEGMFYSECNSKIVEDMTDDGSLMKEVKISHSYPHDWRTKKPVIFRATPQWFASIDPIKDEILKEINGVNWNPSWGNVRISNMVKDRHDWCISRQRAWGVPIPVFYAEDDTAILDEEVMKHISNLFKESGSNIWFRLDAKELLPAGYTHKGSPNGIFRKEEDIMDVWFDSGSSYKLLERRNLPYPADLYIEGSDQYRGWFNSSMINGVATTGKSPYKTVVSHGFTLDGKGRKMSKSLGNTVDPVKVCNQKGADILRLWVASIEYRQDMPMSDDLLNQVSESYRKIRNTIRFFMSNTEDYNPKDRVAFDQLNTVDKYMEIKRNDYVSEVKSSYDTFDFEEVLRKTNTYINNTLSAFYLDFTKDILYIDLPSMLSRRSIQTVFYDILLTLVKVLAPIIPHTMSEVYSLLANELALDVYLTDFPKTEDYSKNKEVFDNYEKFMDYRNVILKSLEEARTAKVIGKSFNAKLILTLDDAAKSVFTKLDYDISQLLIVSQLEIIDGPKFKVEVLAAKGHVCSRCWRIVEEADEDELCSKCASIVEQLDLGDDK